LLWGFSGSLLLLRFTIRALRCGLGQGFSLQDSLYR